MSGTVPETTDWVTVVAVTLGITAFALAQGLTYPLLSFLLSDMGASDTLVGIHAAVFMLGFVTSVIVLPTLNRSLRAGTLIAGGLGLAAATLVGFALTESLAVWLVLRFVLGACVNTIYVLGEAWLNAAAADRVRGRIAGVYGMGMSLGFALGPIGIPLFGSEGGLAFAVCASLVGLVAFIFGLLARRTAVEPERIVLREVFSFLRLAPTMVLLLVAFGIFDTSAISILPLYLEGEGVTRAAAATFVTVLHIGMIAAQPFLGTILDRYNRWTVVVSCLVITGLSFVILPLAPATGLILWPVAALVGAAYFGIYTSAIALLGQTYKGSLLVAGSAAFSLAFALGGAVGPIATGAALEHSPSFAFGMLSAISLTVAATIVITRRHVGAVK